MKTIVNKTPKPLRVPLPQGKTLHLGPLKTGQISVQAADHPPVKKLAEAGTVEIYDASGPGHHDHEHGGGPHESTSGGPAVKGGGPQRRGDRGT